MAISPPNANSNMPVNAPTVNSNMPTQVPAQSSAQLPAGQQSNQQQQQGSNQSFITPLEMPVMQAREDKIQMQKIGVTANETRSLINDYREAVQKYGPQMLGMEAEDLKQKHTALTLKLKDLAQLGVLAGPDLELLYDLITPPTRS